MSLTRTQRQKMDENRRDLEEECLDLEEDHPVDKLDLIDGESDDVKEYNSKLHRINKLIRLNREIITKMKEEYGNPGDMTDEDKIKFDIAFYLMDTNKNDRKKLLESAPDPRENDDETVHAGLVNKHLLSFRVDPYLNSS